MRAFLFALLSAAFTVATVQAADTSPPPAPLNLNAPVVNSDLPDMGSPASTILSQTDEQQLGAMVARQLHDQNALLEDPEISEYVNSIGTRLAAQSPDGGAGFHFFAIKDSAINAFAVPGGYVFINTGLIQATSNESELASVMGHEIAHVTQHHIARAVRAQSQQSLTTAATMLAAIALGILGGGQVMEAGILASQSLAIQQQINFTRDNESEADRVGIGYVAGAGFDTQAMGDFFETLSRKEGVAATYIPAMLVDHPVTTDRIAEARARAAQFPPRKGKDSETYPLIRERVRILTAPGDTDVEKQYASRIARGDHSLATMYGDALALIVDNNPVDAEKILHKLVQQHDDITLLYAALGQAEAKAGQTNDALSTFKQAMDLFPRNVPVTVRYAETLMNSGNPKQAHSVLLDLFNNVEPTPDQIRMTANAANAAGDAGDAYYYMGEYYVSSGDLALATQQYQLALNAPNLTSIQRQRYQARLDEVTEFLRSQKKRRVADVETGGPAH